MDNQAPWASVTSPARVTAEAGGDVYTTNAEAHVYVPPHGLAEDALITLAALGAGDVPTTQAGGAELVHPGYRLDCGGAGLRKPVTLDMSYAGSDVPPGSSLALYMVGSDSLWRRLGGTAVAETRRISLAVAADGRYALYAEAAAANGSVRLANLSMTPRVFSPRGTYATGAVAIGFDLGRAGSVTVKVYTRAGRLVREVLPGQTLGPGANLVRWDGRDREGSIVEPGALHRRGGSAG